MQLPTPEQTAEITRKCAIFWTVASPLCFFTTDNRGSWLVSIVGIIIFWLLWFWMRWVLRRDAEPDWKTQNHGQDHTDN